MARLHRYPVGAPSGALDVVIFSEYGHAHALVQTLDEAAYLEAERASSAKHEYVAGEVFAMTGASKTHGTLALNAAFALRAHLRDGPCRTWMAA